ncbi:MAG: hypothetical protein IIY16_00165 [Oscillospiraceae bacterium]|nr:hypothetical protein [Oscillospiraceae bacterium]
MDNQKFQPPMVGGSSLLVVFAVLCLTVFALLGFSTVQADQRLSDASIGAVADYYEADSQAEAILAQLRSGSIPEGVTEADGVYSYACTVSDTQELQVEVRIEGENWEILRWQTVSTVEWSADEPISVWDGKG